MGTYVPGKLHNCFSLSWQLVINYLIMKRVLIFNFKILPILLYNPSPISQAFIIVIVYQINIVYNIIRYYCSMY